MSTESSLRILLIEDDSAYAEFVEAMLQGTSSVRVAVDCVPLLRSAVDCLAEHAYDIALVDLGLPDARDLEALTTLVAVVPELPVVILSSMGDEQLALRAVKSGAQDYLTKDSVTPELLVRAIRYAIERKQSELQIKQLAYYDSLTKLPNRLLLLEHLGLALRRAARTGSIVGVFFIDIDRFKQVNDAYGHETGDRVLAQLASRLSNSLRRSDTLGRLSGDEFVAVVDADQTSELEVVAESLRRAMEGPIATEGGQLFTTASVGVSTFPADGNEVEELLRSADRAMYRSKARGRDTVSFSFRDA